MPRDSEIEALALLHGADQTTGVVAIEEDGEGTATLFRRVDGEVRQEQRSFRYWFILADLALLDGCRTVHDVTPLASGHFRHLVECDTWRDLWRLRTFIVHRHNTIHGESLAPKEYRKVKDLYLVPSDVEQFMVRSGVTQFKDMAYEDLRRLQFDLEVSTSEGFAFPNARRAGDRIIIVALRDSTGWEEVVSLEGDDEGDLIHRVVELIRQRDPDVIEIPYN